MESSFLIIRFVGFAMFFIFALLILIFAAWNIAATRAVGITIPATPAFMIFGSCLTFICLVLEMIQIIRPQIRTSTVLFECTWAAVLSILQLGSAISITINGPPVFCRGTVDWNVCASASLLVPSGWLSTCIGLTYFFVLFITSMIHAHRIPDFWTTPVHRIRWFERGEKSDINDFWLPYLKDIESSQRGFNSNSNEQANDTAPWARSTPVRRGVDNPFAVRDGSPLRPISPLRVIPQAKLAAPGGSLGSRFFEGIRNSNISPRSDEHIQHGVVQSGRISVVRRSASDYDLPIPLPRLSEWLRAEAFYGTETKSDS